MFGNKYEIYEKLRKLNTSIRAKLEREQATPSVLGVDTFSKNLEGASKFQAP
jgi:hypothetical protein